MKNQVSSTSKRQDSILKSCFTAFPFIGAFTLSEVFVYPYILLISLIPIIACECILLAYYGRRVKRKGELADLALQENPPKPKGTPVSKGEVVGSALQFSVAKGILKKRLVVVKEIPVFEISSIETVGNELSVTWNGVTDTFSMEKKGESFGTLCNKVKAMIEEHQKLLEFNEKSALRRNELLGVINASIRIVDLSFDILIGLQVKRINWEQLEAVSRGFGDSLSFTGKTLPPLSLDFANIFAAIRGEGAKETSKAAYEILESVQGYFNGLNLDEDIKEALPNFRNTKNAITAYYVVNDLLLGKVVGDRESKKENAYLETLLENLSKETKVRVNFENLRDSIDRMGPEADRESVIEDSRDILREQLKNIDCPVEQLLTVQLPTELVACAQPEPLPSPEPQEPVQPAIEQQQVVQSPTEQVAIEQPEPMVQPLAESLVIEQQEDVQPSAEQPSVQQQESAQAEAALSESESATKPSEPPANKKGIVGRLRKKLLGY